MVITMVAVTAALVSLTATGLMWRRLQRVEAALPRLDRMAEAIGLLTETTEAGLGTMAAELERLQKQRVSPPRTRVTVSRRVIKAASSGESVAQIARREALSEGEVRLHLALAETDWLQKTTLQKTTKKGTAHGRVRA